MLPLRWTLAIIAPLYFLVIYMGVGRMRGTSYHGEEKKRDSNHAAVVQALNCPDAEAKVGSEFEVYRPKSLPAGDTLLMTTRVSNRSTPKVKAKKKAEK